MLLRLSVVDCECGELRPLAASCNSCGRKASPREYDFDLVGRRRTASTLRELLRQHRASVPEASETELLAELGRLVEEVMPAGQAFLSGADAGARHLEQLVNRCTLMLAQSDPSKRLRPERSLWILLNQVVLTFQSVLLGVLDAIAANSPIDARAAERDIQVSFDRCSGFVKELPSLMNVRFAPEGEDVLLWSVRSLIEHCQARGEHISDSVSFAVYGQRVIDREMNAGTFPVEVTAYAAFADSLANVYLDRREFWSKVRTVFGHLSAHSGRALSQVSERDWLCRWNREVVRLYSAHRKLDRLLHESDADEQFVAWLEFAHGLQEGLLKTLLVTLRSSATEEEFHVLLAGGVQNTHEWSQKHLGDLTKALGVPTRAAVAHTDYTVENGVVHLRDIAPGRSGPFQLNGPQLLDHSLEVLELTLAAQLSFVMFASTGRTSLTLPMDLKLDWSVLVTALLSATLGCISLRVADDELEIDGFLEGKFPVSAIASIIGFVPDQVSTIRMLLKSAGGTRTLDFPVGPWRSYQAAEELDKEVMLMRIFSTACRNSEVLLSHDHAAVLLARLAMKDLALAGELASGGVSVRIAGLKRIRREAQWHGTAELNQACGVALKTLGLGVPDFSRIEVIAKGHSIPLPNLV